MTIPIDTDTRPVLSAAPAVVFGIGIALGTAKGAKLVRRSDGTRQITS